jgi:hypothetical protein
MPAIHYTATDFNGVVHTRSTKSRAYTHTVVRQHSKVDAYARSETDSKRWDTQQAKEEFMLARSTIEEIKAWLVRKQCAILARDDAYATERKAKAEVFVATHGTVEAYVAAKLAERAARIEATDWSIWHNVGWCGRIDLARKLAAQNSNSAILTAVEKK